MGRFWQDGTIEFLGRKDHQVKIRGHRIELGEIEHTIQRCEGVEQVVVDTFQDGYGKKSLVAYIGAPLKSEVECVTQITCKDIFCERWKKVKKSMADWTVDKEKEKAYQKFMTYGNTYCIQLMLDTLDELEIFSKAQYSSDDGKIQLPIEIDKEQKETILRWINDLLKEGIVREEQERIIKTGKKIELSECVYEVYDYFRQLKPCLVKLIFTMAADGRTKGQIAKHLNETHVLTCREYMCRKGIKMHRENEKEKKLWSVTTISDMLKNEVYLGKIIWNKKRVARTGSNKLVSNDKEEWIVVENAHEPIISDELFQKANEKAFTNQKRVLTKRGVACPIFFCPTCGRRLGFTSRETGYRCMQAHISGLSGCAESKMDRKEAEETVLDAARNMAQLISENLEKKKSEWHKTILKEENIATLESEKKRLSSRKMKLYSDYRSEVLDKEGYMEELEKTTSRISEITLQIAELENEIAVAKKKCDEATEKEMEVNEIAALQDFDKIQLSKIIEKVFIYEPGRMEISWKMDDIFYKEEKA